MLQDQDDRILSPRSPSPSSGDDADGDEFYTPSPVRFRPAPPPPPLRRHSNSSTDTSSVQVRIGCFHDNFAPDTFEPNAFDKNWTSQNGKLFVYTRALRTKRYFSETTIICTQLFVKIFDNYRRRFVRVTPQHSTVLRNVNLATSGKRIHSH